MPVRARISLLGLVVVAFGATAQCRRAPEDTGTRVIIVWAHHGREAENLAMRRIIDAFNDDHRGRGLRAEITFFPDRQYADKVSIASASGSLPDVLDVDGPYVGPWAAEGLLQPIGDFVGPELRDDMLPSLVQQGTYRGKLYTLGAFESALVVYYNRDMVDKTDIMPPERLDDAWTWDQFVDALERVKPHAAVPLSLHMDDQSDEWFTYAFSPLIWSNGGRLISADGSAIVGVLDSPENTAAIQRWQDLFQRQLAEPTSTNPNPFTAGLAAFDWTGHWMLPSFEQVEGLRFGVMPLPRMGSTAACASGSWCWGLSRDCDDPTAAWPLVEWLIDPEQGIRPIVQANGAVPGRRSAFDLFPEYERMPRRLFREQLESAAHPRPRTAIYLSLTSAFARALRDIALGADVQTALRQAAESAQRVADRQHDKPDPTDERS